jgi:hypothetical protein
MLAGDPILKSVAPPSQASQTARAGHEHASAGWTQCRGILQGTALQGHFLRFSPTDVPCLLTQNKRLVQSMGALIDMPSDPVSVPLQQALVAAGLSATVVLHPAQKAHWLPGQRCRPPLLACTCVSDSRDQVVLGSWRAAEGAWVLPLAIEFRRPGRGAPSGASQAARMSWGPASGLPSCPCWSPTCEPQHSP